MSVSIWRELLIDRINISVGIAGKDLYAFAISQMYGMKDLQKELLPNGKITIKKEEYVTRLNYYAIEGGVKIADITVGITKSKHRYFKLGLYPSKYKKEEFERFKEILSVLMPDFSYEHLYETGRVSYIEFAKDSLTYKAHTFIPFRAYCRASNIFKDFGSTYLGSNKSDLVCCIYDKNKQLIVKKLKAPFALHTRIEMRLKHIGLTPSQMLLKLGNPFNRLEIADLNKAKQISDNEAWQTFLKKCLEMGAPKALTYCPANIRKKYIKRLRESAVSWWDSNKVWGDFSKAMEVIAP